MELEKFTAEPEAEEYRTELLLRAASLPSVRGHQERLVEEVRQLSEAGRIGVYSLVDWDRHVLVDAAPRTEHERAVRRRIDEITGWAAQNEVSLEPGFEHRQVDSFVEGSYTVFVPPVVGLVLRDDTGIRGVFPCRGPDGIHGVADCLTALRRGARPGTGGHPGQPDRAGTDRPEPARAREPRGVVAAEAPASPVGAGVEDSHPNDGDGGPGGE